MKIFDLRTGTAIADLELVKGIWDVPPVLAFSPDGTEVAGYAHGLLVAWTADCRLVFNERVPGGTEPVYKRQLMDWLPDKSGWLIEGNRVFDRNSKQFVWTLVDSCMIASARMAVLVNSAVMLDQSRILAVRKNKLGDHDVVLAEIPVAEMDAFLNPSDDATQLFLGNGKNISLEMNVDSVRSGNSGDVQQKLQEALTKCTSAAGFSIADGAPIILRVKYSESEGKKREVVKSRVQSSGVFLNDTIARVELSLVIRDRNATIWSKSDERNGGIILKGELNDATLRNEASRVAIAWVGDVILPSYVTSDGQLPGVVPFRL